MGLYSSYEDGLEMTNNTLWIRSRSPSGLVSDFPIVALLALTVSIDRQVIKKSKLGNISSSGDTGALIRLVKKSGRAPFSFLIREVARPAHTIFTFVPSLPLLRTWAKTLARPVGLSILFGSLFTSAQHAEDRGPKHPNVKWTWEMTCNAAKKTSQVRVDSRSWKAFVDDNNLKVGDGCVFELMECSGTKLMFRVQILRGDIPAELVDKYSGEAAANPFVI
ncbi:hypothetical protein ACLB2K_077166 [Fragaria x ananassa]